METFQIEEKPEEQPEQMKEPEGRKSEIYGGKQIKRPKTEAKQKITDKA